MFVCDEAKRKTNLEKHGLGFLDAHLVYNNPEKFTYAARNRAASSGGWNLALALVHGKLLALIHKKCGEDVRVISFRPASREERNQYEQDKE